MCFNYWIIFHLSKNITTVQWCLQTQILIGMQCNKYTWAFFAMEWNKILQSFRLIGLYCWVHCYHNNSERCIFQNTALIHLVQAPSKDHFIAWLLGFVFPINDDSDIPEPVPGLEIFPKKFLGFWWGYCSILLQCGLQKSSRTWAEVMQPVFVVVTFLAVFLNWSQIHLSLFSDIY